MYIDSAEYLDTKLIMQGKRCLEYPFAELANKIQRRYAVRPINFHYDDIGGNRSRLQIIVETMAEANKFPKGLFYDLDEKAHIAGFFRELFVSNDGYPYTTIEVFETAAKTEANHNVPDVLLEELKQRFKYMNLWEIKKDRNWSVIYLFETNDIVNAIANTHIEDELKRSYFNSIKQYDEFDYIKYSDFYISLDSRENFISNYKGHWQYYFMDN